MVAKIHKFDVIMPGHNDVVYRVCFERRATKRLVASLFLHKGSRLYHLAVGEIVFRIARVNSSLTLLRHERPSKV